MINSVAQKYINSITYISQRIKPLVVITAITYNHEPYLRDALEGFVIQKTNFPFVAIVHDDASTDGTASILREYAEKYPDIILPIFERDNQYSKHDGSLGDIIITARESTGAKYVALCEGDDYWTDPYKLQKQVDFLESHPNYGMCYTQVERLNQITGQVIDQWGGPNETFESLYIKNTIPTLTVILRTSLYSDYTSHVEPAKRNWKMGDYPIWLYLAAKSKIKFLNEVTGVYRVLPESASHSKSIEKIFRFRSNFYKIGEEIISLLNYPIAQNVEESHSREKYFHILSLAILLDDEELITEAKSFYKIHKKSTRDYLLLRWRRLMKFFLNIRYRNRGFRIN